MNIWKNDTMFGIFYSIQEKMSRKRNITNRVVKNKEYIRFLVVNQRSKYRSGFQEREIGLAWKESEMGQHEMKLMAETETT